MSKAAFQAILTEGTRVGWPLAFKDDLEVHDRNRLYAQDPPTNFGWILGKSHTLLLDARMSAKNRSAYLDHLVRDGSDDRAYFWDGFSLREMSIQAMGELMLPHCAAPASDRDSRGMY